MWGWWSSRLTSSVSPAGTSTQTGPTSSSLLPLPADQKVEESPAVEVDAASEEITPHEPSHNPGKFENIENTYQDILDIDHYTFRGIQLTVQNLLHPHFVTIGQASLGKRENTDPMTGQKDGETARLDFMPFVKTKNWTLNGRFGTAGMTMSRFSYERGPFVGTFQGQFAGDEAKSGWQAEAQLKFHDATLEAKLQSPALGLCYTQALTELTTFGTELLLAPLNGASRIKFAVASGEKNSTGVYVGSYTTGMGPDTFGLGYVKNVIPSLTFGVNTELTLDPKSRAWSSLFRLGYHYQNEMLSVRSTLDSAGGLALVMEEPVSDLMMVTVTSKINFKKNIYDIGAGLQVQM